MRNLHKQAARPLSDDTRYIYALVDPRTGFIRYIGKAKDTKRRYAGHLIPSQLESHSHHRANWLKELLRLGLKPIMEVLETVPTAEWEVAEREWIARFRNIPGYPDLTNATDGGEGVDGFTPSKEVRQRIAESHRGKTMPPGHGEKVRAAHKGRVHTAQARANMSAGRKIWWKNLSTEERDKITTTMRSGITDETRKKAGAANRNKPRRKDVTSKYRGVSKKSKPARNLWVAFQSINRKPKYLGSFATEEEAAHARDRFVINNFPGLNIELNFPRNHYPDLLPPTSS
jgi:hypothetical protein